MAGLSYVPPFAGDPTIIRYLTTATDSSVETLSATVTPSLTDSLTSTVLAASATLATPSANNLVHNPNPTTPPYSNDLTWIRNYLWIHRLSFPSYRYAYILWLFIGLVVLLWGLSHYIGARGGSLGARWQKWALRRRTFRKNRGKGKKDASKAGGGGAKGGGGEKPAGGKGAGDKPKPHRQPEALPSNAQLLSIIALFLGVMAICFVGPDYIAPGTHFWDIAHNLTARSFPTSSSAVHELIKRSNPACGALCLAPPYTIEKAWWTVGARNGLIAFALFPLIVFLGIKSAPVAIFATITQLYFDKLARLHKWGGRLVYFVTVLHAVTWGVQLIKDHRYAADGTELKNALQYMPLYQNFTFAIVAFSSFTLLVILSLPQLRENHYELFYLFHVLLVPMTLIFSALHFPPLQWWCWGSLAIWGGDRIFRLGRFMWVNGVGVFGVKKKRATMQGQDYWEMGFRPQSAVERPAHKSVYLHAQDSPKDEKMMRTPRDSVDSLATVKGAGGGGDQSYFPPQQSTNTPWPDDLHGAKTRYSMQFDDDQEALLSSTPLPTNSGTPLITPFSSILPPQGFAVCHLMAGKTIRVTVLTARPMMWAPGQHALLTIPDVKKFQSHPFTIASVSDRLHKQGLGREVVFLIRARKGFTLALWEEILRQSQATPRTPGAQYAEGIVMRAYVDGPFGSVVRARWGNHSTVLIIAGGSGVSFAVSMLQYLCLGMSGRDTETLGRNVAGMERDKFITKRVRFVWIVREYAHLQWCSSVIRRCMDMVSRRALQIDLFVTNTAFTLPEAPPPLPTIHQPPTVPAVPSEAIKKSRLRRTGSSDSVHSQDGDQDIIDLSYALPAAPIINETGHDEHILDLTNFNGEDDTRVPGEIKLSMSLRREGKMRRAKTRKAAAQGAAQNAVKRHSKRHSGDNYFIPPVPPMPGAPTYSDPFSDSGAAQSHHRYSTSESAFEYPPSRPTGPRRPSSPLFRSSDSPMQSPTSATSPATAGYISPTTPSSQTAFYSSMGAAFSGSPRDNRLSSISESGFSVSESAMSNGTSPHDRRSSHGGAESVRALQRDEDLSYIHIGEAEADDLNVVSEIARTGKPKLDRILADEVEAAMGPIAVGCCGTTSLNAMVRKIVAAQIDPARVAKGDVRGNISLINEDFAW